MKLIIDIPKEVKDAFDKANDNDINFCYYDCNSVIGKAFKNGIPLPKGHGDLIDRDALPVDFFINDKGNKECVVTYDALEDAQVVVEADRSER